jgi:hypothetical protein
MALKARARASKADSTTNGNTGNGTTIDNDDKKKTGKVLTSAPPPWHSVAVLGLMALFSFRLLPAWSVIDEIAVTETFTRRIFPELMSLQALATIRTVQAVIIWATSFHTIFISKGWEQRSPYLPHSQLKMVANQLVGLKTMFPLTSICWNLLGVAFTLSAYITWSAVAMEAGDDNDNTDQMPSIFIMRTAILVWEVAAPMTLLVAAIVRYVIWPGVLGNADGDTSPLRHGRNILMHNINVLLALTETCLAGGLPVRWSEVGVAPILGISYVFFSWNMTAQWNDVKLHGPQFIYFFLDTTLGATTSYAMVGLLFILLVFYTLFVSVELILEYMDGGWPFHVAFVVAVCSAVMRFRD